MKTRYSKQTGSFYPFDINYDPEALPADVVEVPIEAYQAAMGRPTGATFDIVDGECVITLPPPETVDQIRARALVELRAQRAPMLDALNGIASRAARRGDTSTATAADAAADALLDITALPAFLAAETYDDMKAAILARYREIAEAAPAAVQIVFVEVFG